MLQPIVNEIDTPKAETNDNPPRGKDITPPNSVDGKTDEEKQSGESLIADFLTDSDEDDDDDDIKVDPPNDALKKASEDLDDATDDATDDDDSGNKFTALSNDLFKLGVFNKEEDEEVSISYTRRVSRKIQC